MCDRPIDQVSCCTALAERIRCGADPASACAGVADHEARIARACVRCWASKTRCCGGRPCVRCVQHGLVCVDRVLSKRESRQGNSRHPKAVKACAPCNRSKVACPDTRPCPRCVRLHIVKDCVIVPRKKPANSKPDPPEPTRDDYPLPTILIDLPDDLDDPVFGPVDPLLTAFDLAVL
ncbi:Zn(2)-C6 fungal-type domain-containing protein [Plasmodiophora brassicae]|uniref:Zn(2)-C6 fungal-type domain-containing protein n=1 Tax=Plasmodiophora brassicae TaxID=37360 RepID=A0A0G4IX14_PLABS|nr:hypothetical protein PBRA_007372 [Plasmodiophora brassicae]SPQ98026.1 unnamed protein product [Plasmodiophora brassicae]